MKKINVLMVICIALISMTILSCGKINEKEIKTAKDTTVKKETVKEVEKKNTVLEGTWISADDVKYQVQAKANAWIEMYEGEKTDTFKFAFGDTCLANADVKANPNGKYMTVFDPDGNRCFYIINVNDAKLELSYVGRGNTLTFKKKK